MLSELIELIFRKCGLRYGRDFAGRWEGYDINDVMDDWAHELKGISPESVAYALQNLPDKPPTVGDFKKISLNAPTKPLERLDPPKANPELVKAEIAKAKALLTQKSWQG
jgi:hypothetical protein